ncbi:hypothetical protein C8R34_11089 [Nitrosomonas sp. Nm84]|uniref:hypothetical protein n=1 Tax=Nitrosomonas sp. Nm84 TaxID=200124 RepID=UPI000D770F0D|nr:hypothetical protein [Nitrosomonas sp. Nm84]PXW87673.1 hypothetical protein C8R34_11089 [Nitrosomonas sp. Nm84]
MNSFAEKKEIPTTDEYLKVSLNEVLDRLNKNPSGVQSEEAFVHAVITVRNAMITEKLTKWLIGLTAVVAIATALLVVVPFIASSLEDEKMESKIAETQAVHESMQLEVVALKSEVLELKQALSVLNNQMQKHSDQLNKDTMR